MKERSRSTRSDDLPSLPSSPFAPPRTRRRRRCWDARASLAVRVALAANGVGDGPRRELANLPRLDTSAAAMRMRVAITVTVRSTANRS